MPPKKKAPKKDQNLATVLAGSNWEKKDKERFAHMQMIACLRIEVNTGMRHSKGSVLQKAHALFPKEVTNKTKKGALRQLEDLYEKKYGRKYGDTPTIKTIEKAEVFQYGV